MFKFIAIIAFASCALSAPATDVVEIQPADEVLQAFCLTMSPGHGGGPAQDTLFPVTLTVSDYDGGQVVRPRQTLTITLESLIPGFLFGGFFMQARQIGSTVPIGEWAVDADTRTFGCAIDSWEGNDSVGQSDANTPRNHQLLHWTAPLAYDLEERRFTFVLTIVERFGIYWSNQTSSTFTLA